VRQAVDLRDFPSTRRFNLDYVYDFSRLSEFFAGDPSRPEAWEAAITRVRDRKRSREALASIVAAQQLERGAPDAARGAATRLTDTSSVAIVTGQQAGVFGGPLYTLLKAVMTVRLADEVSKTYRLPVVPVFWIDSEDHDWAEVSTSRVLDRDLALRRVTVPGADGAGVAPVARVRLPASVSASIDALRDALPPTEFTDQLLVDLADAYRPGMGISAAFGRWIERLLGPQGLVVFDGADPAAKPLVSSVFQRELEEPARTAALAAEAGRALVERGYHMQVTPAPDSVSLFYLNSARLPIRVRDGALAVGDETRALDALRAEAETEPAHFSPNVVVRPIVQDTLFPTIAYVAGPNEMAYLAQLRRVYEYFDVPMPLVVPRASATILDSAAARFLTRYDLRLHDLRPPDESTLNRLLESRLPASVEQAFAGVRLAVTDGMTTLIGAVPAIDATLEGAARSTLGRIEHDLKALHTKIIHAAKKRDETLHRQFTRAQAQAFPEGDAQERAVGSISFLNRFGPSLVEHLRNELPLEPGCHWVLTP
jgi:bacillithiol biosynthesis cysteine-adding enzyme BshC